MALQFISAKLVKYWNGSAWAESQDFGSKIKLWNGYEWQYVDIRPYVDIVSETQTVTVGALVITNKLVQLEFYGYVSGYFGSISDGTFELISNAVITNLSWNNSTNGLNFTLVGNRSNSGWSSVTINGITFNRSAASYSYDSGQDSTSWSIEGANPFGTTEGITRAAVFTP